MTAEMPPKFGFVAIVGRANAGKSTLVNRLVGEKVAIVSPRPQTTRQRIQGIVNRDDAQMVLVDTPGIHKPENALGKQMMNEVRDALEGVDVLCLIVDARDVSPERLGPEDRFVLNYVKRFSGTAFLLLNKVDGLHKEKLLPIIEFYGRQHGFAEIIPISALKGAGIEDLLRTLVKYLPEGEPQFPADQYTDQPQRFLAAEIIREKAILITRQEVPHSIAVLVDSFAEGAKLTRIRATIYVEREGQKGIIIGKGAASLKRIGTDSRLELESLLGTKVFLDLHVKVQPHWRENRAMVSQLDWRQQLGAMSDAEEELDEEQA